MLASAPPPLPHARHILSFVQTLGGGGVERVLLRLATAWLAADRRVTLLVGKREGPLAAELPAGIEIVEIGSARFPDLRVLPAIARQVAADVVFCPGNHYSSIAIWTRLRLGRQGPPVIAKISNSLVRRDHHFPLAQAYRFWLRRHPPNLDHFVAMSPAMRDEAMAMMGAAPDQVSVIANPPLPPDLAPLPFVLPDRPVIAGVGRLEPQKRWDRAIAALPLLADQRTTLVIAGEGSERAALEAQVAALGLGERVLLPGHVDNVAPILAAASVAVLTSDFEGVPGALREALALGTPVVATESSVAMREIVASPALGDLVPLEDSVGLVTALDRWLAPDAVRPDPVPAPGVNAATDYLALFDRLVAARRGLAVSPAA